MSKEIIDISKVSCPQWENYQARTIQSIEAMTKKVGEILIHDFEQNNNITQEGVYALLPYLTQVIAKKQMLNNPTK